jgi:hypothetical protein
MLTIFKKTETEDKKDKLLVYTVHQPAANSPKPTEVTVFFEGVKVEVPKSSVAKKKEPENQPVCRK